MLKHLDDDANLNMLIDDSGTLLVICEKCHNVWKGELALVESPTAAKKLTKRPMSDTLMEKPALLKNLGIDKKYIAGLKF